MNRSPLRAFLLIALTLGWLAISPQARAVCQEGCLTGNNTVLGDDALFSLTTGFSNTAIGNQALYSNTTGNFNTANGDGALYSNPNGSANTANGVFALYANTTGSNNTANGANALLNNTTGNFNTANGDLALYSNTTGFNNTATGDRALYFNTTGNNNVAEGVNALQNKTTGGSNIALGFQAGRNLTTGGNNIDIGAFGVAGESNKIRIGTVGTHNATFIAGISGATVPGGVGVIIGSNGKLGTVVSSERFKGEIKPMDKASEAILSLKPVTFHYTKELDPEGIPQFGLVAEEVEKVNPDLVARDDHGKPYTVRYEAVNAMLLNEFLKEHRKGQEQDATITQLKSAIAQQRKEIQALMMALKEQAAQIEKVREDVATDRRAPRLVVNEP